MPPVGPITRRELLAYLRKLGFTDPYAGGKHPYMDRDGQTVTIPNSHRGDIGRDLLLRILQQAGIDRATWEAL